MNFGFSLLSMLIVLLSSFLVLLNQQFISSVLDLFMLNFDSNSSFQAYNLELIYSLVSQLKQYHSIHHRVLIRIMSSYYPRQR